MDREGECAPLRLVKAKAHFDKMVNKIEATTDLLMEAFHGQKACLRLLGVLLGGLGSGEGFAIQGSEACLRPEEAWHEEVKQGPELQHIILDGGASQHESVVSH